MPSVQFQGLASFGGHPSSTSGGHGRCSETEAESRINLSYERNKNEQLTCSAFSSSYGISFVVSTIGSEN